MSTYIGLAWHLLIIVSIAFARITGEEVKCGQRHIDLVNPGGVNTQSSDLNKEENKRILGGHEANHGVFSWQVKLAQKGEEKTSHLFGGAILSEYWILTAAHCYLIRENVDYQIIVGDFNENEPDEGEQEFDMEKIITNENFTSYKDDSLDYDIALIKVSPNDGHGILFNQYVQPVCLPDPSIQTDENVMCAASGWGDQSHGGTEILRYVHMPIQSQKSCLETYHADAPYTDRMICAGYKEGGVDTCQGESGGPLVCINNGDYALFGITSWGPECGTGLGYYANVRFFMPWIIANMNATFPEPTTTLNYYYEY